MAYWLKLGYFTDSIDEKDASYWGRPWVSDSPGRHSPYWDKKPRPRKGQTYPFHGPQYAIGDRLVIYVKGRGCPAILEVVGKPYWDPSEVDRPAPAKEGNRWGVVTNTKCLHALPLGSAPALNKIGVEPSSVMQKGHIELQEWQYEEAEKHIAGKRKRRSGKRSKMIGVPLEQGTTEGYDLAPIKEQRRAERREARLVSDYAKYLEKKGDTVERNKILPSHTSHAIFSDIFNATRKQLIEAKAGGSRGEIRMAIGQLADYGRSFDLDVRKAVLLGALPEPDLRELLKGQGIAMVWRSNDGFIDNAGAAFT